MCSGKMAHLISQAVSNCGHGKGAAHQGIQGHYQDWASEERDWDGFFQSL